MVYAPIGDPARYHANIERGQTYSILPAYTISGYLLCTGIKEGFYNTDEFVDWLTEEKSIICLDNVSIHIYQRIQDAMEAKGCLIQYLPPYSPDFNPIELIFSVLKAWMRRNFESFRSVVMILSIRYIGGEIPC